MIGLPVDDIDAAIGSFRKGDRAEEGIVAGDHIGELLQVPTRSFAVHARKAWLQGLSPKENRTIPPLDYDLVRRLKRVRAFTTGPRPNQPAAAPAGEKTTVRLFRVVNRIPGRSAVDRVPAFPETPTMPSPQMRLFCSISVSRKIPECRRPWK